MQFISVGGERLYTHKAMQRHCPSLCVAKKLRAQTERRGDIGSEASVVTHKTCRVLMCSAGCLCFNAVLDWRNVSRPAVTEATSPDTFRLEIAGFWGGQVRGEHDMMCAGFVSVPSDEYNTDGQLHENII